jgi:hypothetical protein
MPSKTTAPHTIRVLGCTVVYVRRERFERKPRRQRFYTVAGVDGHSLMYTSIKGLRDAIRAGKCKRDQVTP